MSGAKNAEQWRDTCNLLESSLHNIVTNIPTAPLSRTIFHHRNYLHAFGPGEEARVIPLIPLNTFKYNLKCEHHPQWLWRDWRKISWTTNRASSPLIKNGNIWRTLLAALNMLFTAVTMVIESNSIGQTDNLSRPDIQCVYPGLLTTMALVRRSTRHNASTTY